jgi:hypothetical protein
VKPLQTDDRARAERTTDGLDFKRGTLTRTVDSTVLIAAACLVLGWFFMNTLVTEVGALRLTFHFYNTLTLIGNPARILTGIPSGHGAESFFFGLVCLAAVAAVFAPYASRNRSAWLACLAPCVLMIACGLWLYLKSSQDVIADSGRYGELGSQVIQFANKLTNRVGDMAAQRVSIGMGAYVAFVASALLAVRGILRFRAAGGQSSGSPP